MPNNRCVQVQLRFQLTDMAETLKLAQVYFAIIFALGPPAFLWTIVEFRTPLGAD